MITTNMNFEMLNEEIVKVTVSEEGIMVNDAKVIIQDIIASNGIIHAIDAVLMPPSETENSIYDIAKSNANFTSLGE